MRRTVLSAAAFLMLVGGGIAKAQSQAIDLDNLAPALKYPTVQKQEMLEMFLKYVAVESGSEIPAPGDTAYPITPGQIEMARLLKADAEAMGANVTLTEWHYVYVDVPSNIDKEVPTLGFSCHLDYSPEAPGKGIKPQVITYQGDDIKLADGSVISPNKPDGKDLPALVGKTLIHTDGRSLLGGDDKNGCTILMSLLKTVLNPAVKHGHIQFVFCPNEDIGMAQLKIDTTLFNPDILFDVDGTGGNQIMASNFTARGLTVKFIGHPAHPAEAKAQQMGDALAAAATFIADVPIKYRPEHTDGKAGYIHHYQIDQDPNGVNYTVMSRIRYFDKSEGELFDHIIKESMTKVHRDFPYVKTEVLFDGIQYDNVEYSMHPASHNVIARAAARAGQEVNFVAERGGTTAAMFTTRSLKGGMGIFAGQHNDHSVHEYSCLEEMMDAYTLLLYAVDEVSQIEQ
ncbi:tripeptide aminopeptidase PepT [Barnesiella sp. An55]|uniref:tripeptide aminopeptidase PepT n=1 Tax=Barnesiella sp. An55 TaxID=1965646 RepID=UPI000B3800F4|nr:tripeptide aminopeptidase PepT [Barnesiella sp. An55]OUN73764.1 hypothetical protein B5G10_04185 [Barnesiella sp. An55]